MLASLEAGRGLRQQRRRTRVRLCAARVAMSAVATARTITLSALVAGMREATDTRPAVDHRGHQPGHRHLRGHVCRTQPCEQRSFWKHRTVNPLMARLVGTQGQVDVSVSGSGQDDLERCAAAGAILDPGGAAMKLGQAENQREPDS
jgi:hypothetical protein